MSKKLSLSDLKLKDVHSKDRDPVQLNQISAKDIAIIGMAGIFSGADNVAEFWANLQAGKDCIRDFPESRKVDTEAYLTATGMKQQLAYYEGGYLEEIDKFDPLFFKISPKEASLMDPNQRIFLETVYKAIEDAGYGGNQLAGSKTGIYVGFSSDTSVEYRRFVSDMEPESLNIAVPGNIKSIIASRISYFLDLKGPSILVDTACSSALMAVHLACADLQSKRSEIALVGGVKISLMPLNTGQKGWLNIRSSINRARSFDDSSDGTGLGEGAGVVVLKPLAKALEDKDHIYAVIKGTAANQDGSSIGITAPNSLAQAEVIEAAWRDAEIDPETITYIETHGTGTPLGDPIEVDGITHAFRKFTTKKQFCGISAVKTNIGHIDHAAGIAGLIKAVLALQHQKLPPTVHFQKPNQKIKFVESPVYVIDQLIPWETNGVPRRCGVSSFGLSGTNCHVVLEEAPTVPREINEARAGTQIFTLSGKTSEILCNLVTSYIRFLEAEPGCNLQDLCYTANTGRNHYTHRLAILCTNRAELLEKLRHLEQVCSVNGMPAESIPGVYQGEHRVVIQKQNTVGVVELIEREKKELGSQADHLVQNLHTGTGMADEVLLKLCQLYIAGAEIEWTELYRGQDRYRVSLPVYPFERKRCWLQLQSPLEVTAHPDGLSSKYSRVMHHPLFDLCLAESMTQDIYLTEFSVEKHWVLKEHKVQNHYLVPGTTYLEMARALAEIYFPGLQIRLNDIYFLSPLIVDAGEVKEVQTIVQKSRDSLEFAVISKAGAESWIKHAEGKICSGSLSKVVQHEMAVLKAQFAEEVLADQINIREVTVVTGQRWKNLKKLYLGSTELLAEIQLPEAFHHDLQHYALHPALLDMAVNVVTQQVGQGLYLPLTYKQLDIYQAMPATLYSYLVRKDKGKENLETVTFDIELMDETGTVFASIRDYTIKKVHQTDLRGVSAVQSYYEIGWIHADQPQGHPERPQGDVLVFTDERGLHADLIRGLSLPEERVVEVAYGSQFDQVHTGKYIVSGTEEEFTHLLEGRTVTQVLYLSTLSGKPVQSLEDMHEQQKRGVDGLFALTRALVKARVQAVDLVLVVDYASRVTGEETILHPYNASLLGLGKVVSQEYANLQCRCIDLDEETSWEVICAEIKAGSGLFQVAYRHGQRYTPEFRKVDMENRSVQSMEIAEDGVYLITGGTGGIGLEVAKFLAGRRHGVKLALINRSMLPRKEEWPTILAAGTDTKLCQKLRALRELEDSGAVVTCHRADVSQFSEMEQLLGELRFKYGRIRGIVHSAGVAGDGFIIRKEKEVFAEVLAPKIDGTWILDQLTKADQPDFFLLFSSINAILGGPGQGDYTAANSYLDAFAAAKTLQGQRVISINWPAWKETGMAADYGVNHDRGIFKAISTAAALQALEQILQKDISNVLVAEFNYNHEIFAQDQFPIALNPTVKTEIARRRRQPDQRRSARETRQTVTAVLKGRKEGEYTPTEIALANVWSQVLGLEEVDIFEEFYAMGGDSILAIRITNSINAVLQKKVDITDLFQYLTIERLAAFLDEQTPDSAVEQTVMTKGSRTNVYELSNAQKRIWFMQKFDPQMTAYNLPSVMQITDGLDIPLLTRSLQKLVRRHSGLRTIFIEEKGIPKQVILDELELPIDLIDLTGEPEQETRLKKLITEENRKVFDLTKPLVKVKVFRQSELEYQVYINIHHLITDGWSMKIFSDELLSLYHAGLTGSDLELPPISLQYVDWIADQQQWMQTGDFKGMEDYWLNELKKPLPVLNLPTDFPRPQKQTYAGSYYAFSVNREDTARLKVLARESNSTMHMLLLSAYHLLLHKLTGDDDLIIGIPMTGRDDQELEKVIGLFINNICIRIHYADVTTFADLSDKVKAKSLLGYRNSKYPFDHLVMQLNPERDFSRSPIFSTLFQFYNNITRDSQNISLFDLSFLSREVNGEIEVRFEYNTDLFNPETIIRLSGYFVNLVQQICANPLQPIMEISLMTPSEKAELLQSFSRMNETSLPEGQVQQFFELQVERHPDAIALRWQRESLTYQELNRQANQLAHLLKAEGVQPEEPVGIMLDRGMEMVIGLLGILKAGGAYVPLDPEYPADRISYMLQHSETRFLITGHKVWGKVAEFGENRVRVLVDLTGEADTQLMPVPGIERIYHRSGLANQPVENIEQTENSQNLMYIIYTSGSTGVPKGVMVSHSNVLNYLFWSIRDGNLGLQDGMMLVTSMSFDISVFEIFGALLSGASLTIVPVETLRDGNSLLHFLEEQPVNIWHSVPTLIAQVLLAARNQRSRYHFWTRMRRIMIGGEAWSVELAREIREYFPNAEIINMYGPTEATIWVMSYSVGEELATLKTLPIGRPIANNRILILDALQQVCAPGIPGEIYVSGVNVTRGYYKDLEKTAQVFIPDAEGQILYKTGDLGRSLPTGQIEYLGRKDGMVKVRGYRIEVGEIENVLLGHAQIQSAAVVTKPEGDTSKLVCFYTADGDPSVEELRGFLSQKLPAYMIPAQLVQLERLPHTPNGKVDKKTLSGLEVNIRPGRVSTRDGSVDEVEQFLFSIWQELLRTDQFSISDNFFAVGGNSFLVNQMHVKIEEHYPDRLTIVDIFTYPTIEKLAKYLHAEVLPADEPLPAFAEDAAQKDTSLEDELLDLFTSIEKGDLSVEEATKKIADIEV